MITELTEHRDLVMATEVVARAAGSAEEATEVAARAATRAAEATEVVRST